MSSISRRTALREIGATVIGLAGLTRLAAAEDATPIVVYKSPSCGCCRGWVKHMEENGFKPAVTDLDDMSPIKKRYQVGSELASCHTAVVAGYVIEGHVPAVDVRKLLATKPKVVGLTIPGMPQSAPGMDARPFHPYQVLSFDAAGKTTVFAKHDTA